MKTINKIKLKDESAKRKRHLNSPNRNFEIHNRYSGLRGVVLQSNCCSMKQYVIDNLQQMKEQDQIMIFYLFCTEINKTMREVCTDIKLLRNIP